MLAADTGTSNDIDSPEADGSEGSEAVPKRRISGARRDAFANFVTAEAAGLEDAAVEAEATIIITAAKKELATLVASAPASAAAMVASVGAEKGAGTDAEAAAAEAADTEAAATGAAAAAAFFSAAAAEAAAAEVEAASRRLQIDQHLSAATSRGALKHIQSPSHNHSYVRESAETAARSVLRLRGGAPWG